MTKKEFCEDEYYIWAICEVPGYEDFYKEKDKKNNKIWWTSKIDDLGELNISFDRKKYTIYL